MPVHPPTVEELREIAVSFGLSLSDDDLVSFRGLMLPTLESYTAVERLPEPALLPVKYPRTPGYRPGPEENPHNAWYWRCDIQGAPDGPLRGKRVAIKDNVCVAGVPMMNGSATLEGFKVGIVREGFGWDGLSEADVDEAVRDAAHQLMKAGATVGEVSVPLHRQGIHIWNVVAIEGATELMVKGNALGTNWKGYYTTSLLDAYARGLRTRANDLSETVKLVALLGGYLHRHYGGRHYAKGQNLAHTLRAAYDQVLEDVDVLVMPTLPLRPTPIPPPDAGREEYVARALEMIPNTAPFDVTGHPAATVPCQPDGSLPMGMMIIGRSFADATVLRVAGAFEEVSGGFSYGVA